MSASDNLDILDAAEAIACAYGDSETAGRLAALADEVRDAEGDAEEEAPLPTCPICGGNVDVLPRVQCQECGFVFSS
jgi:hypothetical protein